MSNTEGLWLSTAEVATVVIVTTMASASAWHWTDFDGVQAVTNAGIASLVTAVSALAGF